MPSRNYCGKRSSIGYEPRWMRDGARAPSRQVKLFGVERAALTLGEVERDHGVERAVLLHGGQRVVELLEQLGVVLAHADADTTADFDIGTGELERAVRRDRGFLEVGLVGEDRV